MSFAEYAALKKQLFGKRLEERIDEASRTRTF
jgi:hypothetical protein